MTFTHYQYFNLAVELLLILTTPVIAHSSLISAEDLAKMGLRMVLKEASPEATARNWMTPSADTWCRRLRHRSASYHAARINEALRRLITRAGLTTEQQVPLAMDITQVGYYGKERTDYIIGGQRKQGTNWYFKYLVVSVVLHHYRYPLYVWPLTRRDHRHLERTVERALDACRLMTGISLVILDRGFYRGRIVDTLERRILSYAICARKDGRYTRLEPLVTQTTWQPIVLRRGDGEIERISPTMCYLRGFQFGKEKVSSTLLLVRVTHRFVRGHRTGQEEERTLSFLTNWSGPPALIPALYRKRWGIETLFREIWRLLPLSASSNPSIRCFHFGLAVVMYSIWVLANAEGLADLRLPAEEWAMLLEEPERESQQQCIRAFDFREEGLRWLNQRQRLREQKRPPPRRL